VKSDVARKWFTVRRRLALAAGGLILTPLLAWLPAARAEGLHRQDKPKCDTVCLPYFGYFPNCWQPWPADWSSRCPKTNRALTPRRAARNAPQQSPDDPSGSP
jgi:hypothetical protein